MLVFLPVFFGSLFSYTLAEQILVELQRADVIELCGYIPHSVTEFFPGDLKSGPSFQFVSKLFQRQVSIILLVAVYSSKRHLTINSHICNDFVMVV